MTHEKIHRRHRIDVSRLPFFPSPSLILPVDRISQTNILKLINITKTLSNFTDLDSLLFIQGEQNLINSSGICCKCIPTSSPTPYPHQDSSSPYPINTKPTGTPEYPTDVKTTEILEIASGPTYSTVTYETNSPHETTTTSETGYKMETKTPKQTHPTKPGTYPIETSTTGFLKYRTGLTRGATAYPIETETTRAPEYPIATETAEIPKYSTRFTDSTVTYETKSPFEKTILTETGYKNRTETPKPTTGFTDSTATYPLKTNSPHEETTTSETTHGSSSGEVDHTTSVTNPGFVYPEQSTHGTDETRVPVTNPSKSTHTTAHSGICVLTKDSLHDEIDTDWSGPVGWIEKDGLLAEGATSPGELVYINDEIDMHIPVFVSPCKFWLVFLLLIQLGLIDFNFLPCHGLFVDQSG